MKYLTNSKVKDFYTIKTKWEGKKLIYPLPFRNVIKSVLFFSISTVEKRYFQKKIYVWLVGVFLQFPSEEHTLWPILFVISIHYLGSIRM